MDKKNLVILLLVLTPFTYISGAVKLPAIFSDHMVLQQQSDVPVWGWATPGEKIVIRCDWQKGRVKVEADDHGKWQTTIKTPAAGGPFKMTVNGKDNSLTITDILIGEVWLCSGQSNMVFRLSHSIDGEQVVQNANYPTIRYMEVARQVSETPREDAPGSVWEAVTPDNAGAYSAVAMYFAMKLQKEMNVPVGIMEAAWGGTAANSWTPPDILRNDSALSITFERWKEWENEEKGDSISYYNQLTAWKKGELKNKPEMPTSVFVKQRPHREPGTLYNGMIHPIIPYAIKGVLWYQGETNRTWSTEYAYLFKKMILGWRSAWKKEFPFYFVQLAPYGGKADAVSEIMEAQFQVMQSTDKTGMVVTMDVGDMDNIHPTHKKQVGDRLASWALANTYGFQNIPYSGPLFKSLQQNGTSLHVFFDHTGSGLIAKGKPNGFEVIEFNENGTVKAPRRADVKIEGNQLIIQTQNLTKPFIIRYGWAGEMEFANLFNKEGLPASPFRVLVR